jgi:hypothetical protein
VEGPKPEAALKWLQTHRDLVAALGSGDLPIEHAALDAQARSGTVERLRAQLVATGCLPHRETLSADFEMWLRQYLPTVEPVADRLVIQEYATWRVLAAMRRRARQKPLTYDALTVAKSRVQAAVHYLLWLRRDETGLSGATQADLDDYLSRHASAGELLQPFVVWAVKRHKTSAMVMRLNGQRPRRPAGDAGERWALLARLLNDGEIEVTMRVIGCLILLYAQSMTRVLSLQVDDVRVAEDGGNLGIGDVRVRFGTEFVRLPPPLAGLVRELLADRWEPKISLAVDPGPWLFPGRKPGQALSHAWVKTRLKTLGVKPGPTRARAMLHLAQRLDAPLLARMLGISFSTATEWQEFAGQEFGGYVGRAAAD